MRREGKGRKWKEGRRKGNKGKLQRRKRGKKRMKERGNVLGNKGDEDNVVIRREKRKEKKMN